jgi:hypothetical protein
MYICSDRYNKPGGDTAQILLLAGSAMMMVLFIKLINRAIIFADRANNKIRTVTPPGLLNISRYWLVLSTGKYHKLIIFFTYDTRRRN